MTEEDRAAKAARARALLKKRQQQKKDGTVVAGSGTHSPSASLSRSSTPAPRTQDSVISGNDIPALASPPATADVLFDNVRTSPQTTFETSEVPFPLAVKGGGARQSHEDYPKLLQDQRQTIDLLVSEKAALTEGLERLEGVEAKLQNNEAELDAKAQKLKELQTELARVKEENNASLAQARELETQNGALSNKLREHERELHTSRTEAEKLRSQLQESERRTRELEEQIQNDDRVDVLETKLKHSQDRAEDVAFQLSKLKQNHDKLKASHDKLQDELHQKVVAQQELTRKIAELEDNLQRSEDALAKLTSEYDALTISNTSTLAELQSAQASVADLNGKLSAADAELSEATRQLNACSAELRIARRRAEEAEAVQRDLQEEGNGLMRSLEEMRPKIVELTGTKLELMERIEQLTSSIDQRDSTISDLEAQLENVQALLDEERDERERIMKEQGKDKSDAEAGQAELQKAYSDLQTRYDEALAATREIEADRGKQRQTAVRLQQEVDRLTTIERTLKEEIQDLRSQVDEQEEAGVDERRLLDDLQQEVEALRVEIASKDEELSRLRQAGPSCQSPLPSSQSLDDEVKGALTQQLELDLSNAQSTIRSLESSLYDAEARHLSLQKHVATVEDELAQLRNAMKTQRPPYTNQMSGSARRSDDLHRTSFTSARSNGTTRLPPSALIDENLPPATRRQRHISLAMLQARMYSEAEAATIHAAASKTSKSSVTGHGHSAASSMDSSVVSLRWPQFLDESHVFWCATCKGDLIVL